MEKEDYTNKGEGETASAPPLEEAQSQQLPTYAECNVPFCSGDGGAISRGPAQLLPPPPLPSSNVATELPPPSYVECTVSCPHSEEEVREALIDYVTDNCCKSSKPVQDMRIHEITPMHAFRYVLESFVETRIVKVKTEPFTNQYIDGMRNGVTPDKWSVPARPPQAFANSKIKMDLPHSSSVMECHKCLATGFTSCSSCNGMGFSRCSWCSGTGRRSRSVETAAASAEPMPPLDTGGFATLMPPNSGAGGSASLMPPGGSRRIVSQQQVFENCSSCLGMGRTNCTWCEMGRSRCNTCRGHKFMKSWQSLEITWTNKIKTFETERGELRRQMLQRAHRGGVMYNNRSSAFDARPVACNEDPAIGQAAKRLLSEELAHQNQNIKILEFRQRIEIIPVVQVFFQLKEIQSHFYVYGTERAIYFPEGYPNACCPCCTII